MLGERGAGDEISARSSYIKSIMYYELIRLVRLYNVLYACLATIT